MPSWRTRITNTLQQGRRISIPGITAAITILYCPLLWCQETIDTQALFTQKCADCHGKDGQGVADEYADPLGGERSLPELVELIEETMPEDDPDECIGDEAEAVAKFVYERFYSAEARSRQPRPRIELARLTVRQYENVLADLISFGAAPVIGEERGLKAAYYNERNFRGDRRVFERVDEQVEFDFGEGSPDEKKIDAEKFAIQWHGSLIADETGDYEFVVLTENGFRLWVNDDQTPLMDAWVRSGDEREHRATIRLIGGRIYPLRLDFFKFKDKTASIQLQWQPPHRAQRLIPESHLLPQSAPPVFVVTTPFPPDDRSAGYERGASVSRAWEEAVVQGALEATGAVMSNLDRLSKCPADGDQRADCLRKYTCDRVARALRRPLIPQWQSFFVDRFFDASIPPERAVKQSLLLTLTSPRFLYPGLKGGPREFQIAERLALIMWDSLPDDTLWQAASSGRLHDESSLRQQAERMLADPRARAKVRQFLHDWLHVEKAYDISKDSQQYPEFNQLLLDDLLTSLDLSLDEAVWGDGADFRQLFLDDSLWVNERIASFYGLPDPSQDGFAKVPCEASRCAGVLTHPYLMSAFAYHKASSPIHRGVFLVRSVLGRSLKPPPIAVAPLDEGVDPSMTTRERVTLQTRPANCQTCHAMINPLGFSLERFDAVGRFRDQEKGEDIDDSGYYRTLEGEKIAFRGPRELAEFLAASPEVHRSFVEQLFHHMVKQPVAAYGPETLDRLTERFSRINFNIPKLIVEIATVAVSEP